MTRSALRSWLLMALVVASCTTPSATTSTTIPTTTSTVPTTASTTTDPDTVEPCLAGDQSFAVDGALATGLLDTDDGDAELVAGLRWTEYPGCGQVVVELATAGGAPATETGGVRAELLRDLGIVRLRLNDRVSTTAVADRVVERDLVDRVYVVRSTEGALYVDIHLASAVLARANVADSPAEIIVDLQPGGPPLESHPLVSATVVVVSKTAGQAEYPLTVDGYARTSEATVVLRARQGNRLEVEEITNAADYLMTWGEYRLRVASGPTGNVDFFVGEDSPQDGRELGVIFSLVMN
jgi:hypothetical protein